jgi:hypothetical protein
MICHMSILQYYLDGEINKIRCLSQERQLNSIISKGADDGNNFKVLDERACTLDISNAKTYAVISYVLMNCYAVHLELCKISDFYVVEK